MLMFTVARFDVKKFTLKNVLFVNSDLVLDFLGNVLQELNAQTLCDHLGEHLMKNRLCGVSYIERCFSRFFFQADLARKWRQSCAAISVRSTHFLLI